MSHAIDFEGLHEKLFLLQQIAFASRLYCKSEHLSENVPDFDDLYFETWGWTKVLISNYTIECAVKMRMIQEYCANQMEDGELKQFESSALKDLSLGRVIKGKVNLTLRETCNKIVHATDAHITFTKEGEGADSIQYWNGKYFLSGMQGKENWQVELDIVPWCKSLIRYLQLLENKGLTSEMGIDD